MLTFKYHVHFNLFLICEALMKISASILPFCDIFSGTKAVIFLKARLTVKVLQQSRIVFCSFSQWRLLLIASDNSHLCPTAKINVCLYWYRLLSRVLQMQPNYSGTDFRNHRHIKTQSGWICGWVDT